MFNCLLNFSVSSHLQRLKQNNIPLPPGLWTVCTATSWATDEHGGSNGWTWIKHINNYLFLFRGTRNRVVPSLMFQTCPMTCVQRTECPTFLPLLSDVCQTSLVTHLGMSVIVPVTHLCTNPSADHCETIFKRHPGFTGCWNKRTNNGHAVKPCALNHNCKSPCAFNRGHLIIRKKRHKQKNKNL